MVDGGAGVSPVPRDASVATTAAAELAGAVSRIQIRHAAAADNAPMKIHSAIKGMCGLTVTGLRRR